MPGPNRERGGGWRLRGLRRLRGGARGARFVGFNLRLNGLDVLWNALDDLSAIPDHSGTAQAVPDLIALFQGENQLLAGEIHACFVLGIVADWANQSLANGLGRGRVQVAGRVAAGQQDTKSG